MKETQQVEWKETWRDEYMRWICGFANAEGGVPSFTVRSCSTAALRLFKQKATESGRMDRTVLRDGRELLLGNLELLEKHGLKRAACLLFSDRPEQYVSGAWIKIGFFVTSWGSIPPALSTR